MTSKRFDNNSAIKIISLMFVLLFSVLLFTGCNTENGEASSGSVLVYSSVHEEEMTALAAAFEDETGIKVEFVLLSAGEMSARALAEKDSPQADILLGGSMEVYEPLKDEGVLLQYRPQESSLIPGEYSDPDGYWHGWYTGIMAVIYNSERFEQDETLQGINPPASNDDLINQNYKNMFVGPSPATTGSGYLFFANQIMLHGDIEGWEYLNRLNDNVNHYTKGGNDAINLVATGEFAVAYAWAHDSYASRLQGYPLEIVIPDNTVSELGAAAILDSAQNLENAELFMNWIQSEEAGIIKTEISHTYSLHPDVPPPAGMPSLSSISFNASYDRIQSGAMKEVVLERFSEMTNE